MRTAVKHKKGKKGPGPKGPTKFTADIVSKLKTAFSNYANIAEACLYAGITTFCFYYNAPKGSDLYNVLLSYRFQPKLRAKQTIVSKLGEPEMAWKFLKNTAPEEFAEKVINEDVTPAREIDFDAQGQKSLDSVTPQKKL